MIDLEQWITNLIIPTVGGLACLFSLLVILNGTRKDKKTVSYLTAVCINLFLHNFCLFNLEIVRVLRDTSQPGFWRTAMIAYGFGTFVFAVTSSFFVSAYVAFIVTPPAPVKKRIKRLLIGIMVFYTLLLLIMQFTGNLILVDEAGGYSEGRYSFVGDVVVASFMLIDLFLLIRYRKNLSKVQMTAFGFYLGMPVFVICFLRPFFEGLYIVALSTSLSVVIMMFMLVAEQAEERRRQELKNEQLKVDILLGQIQPHFLFNVLYVIQEICHINPEKASHAIEEFSRYLRHNMDSISINTPIPFTEELEHTKHYVYLQQLRFGDSLNIEYELNCTDFYMPTLTLQPIVENAVRYGVRKTGDGRGTVIVRTKEYADRYELEVEDNGPGFDQNEKPQDGISHTGLENVRQRLKRISGGELTVKSEPGKGTLVTMILPKKE